MKATKAAGMNIIANCEEVAGQTVFHTHVHLVPRYSADDDLKIDFIAHEPDFDKLAQVAETIKKCLRSCHEIIQTYCYLQEPQLEVIWSQKIVKPSQMKS